MPDVYQTGLSFGGPISRSNFERILKALDADGVSQFEIDRIACAAEVRAVAQISEEERSWGEFEQTEFVLTDIGAIYSKTVEAKYEFDGMLHVFDGIKKREGLCNRGGEPVVTRAEVKAAIADGTVDTLVARLELLGLTVPPIELLDATPDAITAHGRAA